MEISFWEKVLCCVEFFALVGLVYFIFWVIKGLVKRYFADRRRKIIVSNYKSIRDQYKDWFIQFGKDLLFAIFPEGPKRIFEPKESKGGYSKVFEDLNLFVNGSVWSGHDKLCIVINYLDYDKYKKIKVGEGIDYSWIILRFKYPEWNDHVPLPGWRIEFEPLFYECFLKQAYEANSKIGFEYMHYIDDAFKGEALEF